MPNQDTNGIFYGVISQHSINSEALNEEIYYGRHSTDLAYESYKDEIRTRLESVLRDFVSQTFILDTLDRLLEEVEYISDEIHPRYNDGEYLIETCLDSDLIILKSPYVTWAPPCSPCVPAAGNLDDIRWNMNDTRYEGTVNGYPGKYNETIRAYYGDNRERLTYCLGPDWFDNNQAPYPFAPLNPDGTIGEWTFPSLSNEEN